MKKEKQIRKTTGQIYLDALDDGYEYEAEELRREMHKDYEKSIIECIERGKKEFEGDFFVHVETKKERLTPNVIRNYFIPRKSCPSPFYDQTIYYYKRNDQEIEFLWVVPSKDTCIEYRSHALSVHPEEKALLNFVLSFYAGDLHILSNELNEKQFNTKEVVYGRS